MNKEQLKEYKRRYRIKHKIRISDCNKRYYLRHRERLLADSNAWYHMNKDTIRIKRKERLLKLILEERSQTEK